MKIVDEYARDPDGTLVISPDNESRRELNSLVHRAMQGRGDVRNEEHKLRVLDSQQQMTGADRQWAVQYEPGDVIRYSRGRKVLSIAPGEYACVKDVKIEENRITVERENGVQESYDPRRLSGVTVYQEVARAFSEGDRVQFTAPSRDLSSPTGSWTQSKKSMTPAISKFAWIPVARSPSTFGSTLISTAVTPSQVTAARAKRPTAF